MRITTWIATGQAIAAFQPGSIRADAQTDATTAAPESIGVYDSRVIAYAHFWSAPEQRKRDEMVKAAKAEQLMKEGKL